MDEYHRQKLFIGEDMKMMNIIPMWTLYIAIMITVAYVLYLFAVFFPLLWFYMIFNGG